MFNPSPTSKHLPTDFPRTNQFKSDLSHARRLRKLYPTANIQDFKTHFNSMLKNLSGGIPYLDPEERKYLTPGYILKLYLMSFISDEDKILNSRDLNEDGTLRVLDSLDCILDEARTKKFLSAIKDAVHSFKESKIEVIEALDAGCGGALPLAIQAATIDPRVRVTALELNPASAEMAKQIVAALGLKNQIKVIQTDACTYKHDKEVQIIMSETLHVGLSEEPVVEILNNLAPSLCKGGRMIPESAIIRCGITSQSKLSPSNPRLIFGKDVRIAANPDWQREFTYEFGAPLDRIDFKFTPDKPLKEPSYVQVGMELNLGSETLKHNESLITMPKRILNVRNVSDFRALGCTSQEDEVHVSYIPGQNLLGLIKNKESNPI